MNPKQTTMRKATTLLLLFCSLLVHAQWPTQPDQPFVIADAANHRRSVRAMSDRQGGWYVFWMDDRSASGTNAFHAQHLDSEGFPLWAANGVPFITIPDTNVNQAVPVLLDDGSFMIGYITSSNRLRVIRTDSLGSPLWGEPVVLARPGATSYGTIGALSGLGALLLNDTVQFHFMMDPLGLVGNRIIWNRVDLDGNLLHPEPGLAVIASGGMGGGYRALPDLDGGTVFFWNSGNGAGAALMARRVDAEGEMPWMADAIITQNSPGLSYAYSIPSDGAGSFFPVWVSQNDLRMTRLDTTGTFLWGVTPPYACDEQHTQDLPVALIKDGALYAVWRDNRPPASNHDAYVQQFDLTGAPQWSADGVLAIRTNTYIPTPGLVAGNDGSVIATIDGTALGLCAQRILADGTPAWPGPVAFCTGTHRPFYADQVKLPDGEGGIVAFWTNFNENKIFAARIYENGDLGNHVGIGEHSTGAMDLRIHPSPAAGPFTVVLPGALTIRSVRILNAHGQAVSVPATFGQGRINMNASALPNGIYLVLVTTDTGRMAGRFVVTH